MESAPNSESNNVVVPLSLSSRYLPHSSPYQRRARPGSERGNNGQ